MTEQELTPIQKRRKEIIEQCEVVSMKIDEGNSDAVEELYQLLKEYDDTFITSSSYYCCISRDNSISNR